MARNDKTSGKSTRKNETAPVQPITPFEEMDRLFEDFFGRPWPRAWMRPFRFEHPNWADLTAGFQKMPRVDVIDGDTHVVVRAEIPGVKKEDLDVSISEDTVTIRGSTVQEEEVERANYYRAELSRGEFSRTIALPSTVDAEKSTAKLDNGLLELTMPKIEKAKRHSIKVE